MAIRVFFFTLLFVSLVSYFMPIKNIENKNQLKQIPLLVFNDSTMYTLTTNSMHRIVYAKEVYRYKDRDLMHEGALTLRTLNQNKEAITDTLYSDVVIKRGELYKFFKNVRFQREDYITLNTDELFYDVKKELATNTMAFEGEYYNNKIEGENLYLDMKNYFMKSKNTHFEIDMKN